MRRLKLFTVRVTDEERQLITMLAAKLQRSQSDAVRFVVINAARELITAENGDSQIAAPDHHYVEGSGETASAG